MRVVTRGIVGLAIPDVAVANLLCELSFDDITDGQVQGFYTVAASSRSGVVGVGTRSVVCGAMPSVALTAGHGEVFGLTVVDGEMEKKIRNGQVLSSFFDDDMVCILNSNRNLIAIYKKINNGMVKPYRMFLVNGKE